mgnify:CR=1 FL=1|jgi:hypothetical protein
MAIKTAFFVTLLLTVLVGITLFFVPCGNDVIEGTSTETYFNSAVIDGNNYDPYFQESGDPELEDVKVYQKYKKEGISEVVKVVECNGNCNGKSYDYERS